jgi:hypothetical protein
MNKKDAQDLTFKVVNAKEARDWVAQRTEGRFGSLKASLITQIRTLRKGEALEIPVPADDKKERLAMASACASAIKKAGLVWKIRYSEFKKCLIVIHASRLNGKDK